MELEVKMRFDSMEEFQKVFSIFNLPIIPPPTAVAVSEASGIAPEQSIPIVVPVLEASGIIPEHAICECCGDDFIIETNRKKKPTTCSKRCYQVQYWKVHRKSKDGKIMLKDQEKEVKKKL